ncbi:hypothetical protein [Pseudomonas gingeri]
MAKADLATALKAVEPETKAAQIREVMPIIEAQLKAGVRRQKILDVLKAQGIEVSMETFKSYLYRYRKAQREGARPTTAEKPPREAPPIRHEPDSVTYDTEPDAQPGQTEPVGLGALGKLMNPGDEVNASELARYERAGKRRRG